MTLQELIEYFRAQVSDEEQPYLWSDQETLLYAIDAQDQLVVRMGGIADTTVAAADVGSPVTRLADLALTAGEPFTAHSPHILRVRSGRLVTARRDVRMISEADLHTVRSSPFYGASYGLELDDADEGDVRFGVLGIIDRNIRWVKVPDEADTCRLHVLRLPFPRIVEQEDDLEVDERHHIHLVHWMKHLAYAKQDAETRDDKSSANAAAMFERYAEGARQQNERQKYKPRTVQYGGY